MSDFNEYDELISQGVLDKPGKETKPRFNGIPVDEKTLADPLFDNPKRQGGRFGGIPAANEYDAMLAQQEKDQKLQGRINLMGAFRTTPETAAKASELAKKSSLPFELVQRNIPEVERKVKLSEYSRMLEDSPALLSKMQERRFSALASDDVENLSTFEKVLKKPGDYASSLLFGLTSTPGIALRGVGSFIESGRTQVEQDVATQLYIRNLEARRLDNRQGYAETLASVRQAAQEAIEADPSAYQQYLTGPGGRNLVYEVGQSIAQGAGRIIDLPEIAGGLGPAGEFKRILTMFYNFFSAQLGMVVRAKRIAGVEWSEGQRVQATLRLATAVLSVIVIPATLEAIARGQCDEAEDVGDWVYCSGRASAMFTGNFIPVVRDMIPAMWKQFDPEVMNFGVRISPIESGLDTVARIPKAAIDTATGEADENDAKTLVRGTGYLFGLPGYQAWRTIDGYQALAEGDTDNPAVLLTGPERD